jgi:hypothetical protein
MLREIDDNITDFTDDITSFEDNISQLRLLILFIDNEKLINSTETKINITNKKLSSTELINHIQSVTELKDYKLQYLLNFTIEQSPEELYNLYNNNNNNNNNNELYNLNAITNIRTFQFEEHKYSEKVYFTTMNTLIIIANKNNKYYIKRKINLEKKNTSKKNIKS